MLVRNTIEEFVIEEVQKQVSPEERRDKFFVNELIVTSLNLLPPLYACTERGWVQQRQKIQSSMLEQITNAVQLARAQLHHDPPKFPLPLTLHEIRRSEHCLFQLRRLLDKPDLTWKELPEVLEKRISDNRNRHDFDITVIQEPKLHNPRYEEDVEFYSYYITASYSFVNVLEGSVITETQRRIKQMGKSLTPGIKLDDIVCYVLNRLPPQYVSHLLKFQEKLEQTNPQVSKEVHQGVIDSLMRLNASPARVKKPLPLARFDYEFRQVLPKVEALLKPPKPLSVGNIVDQIEAVLPNAERLQGKLNQLHVEICQAYGLDPAEAGLRLRYNRDGSITFHSAQDTTVWAIAEKPSLASYLSLLLFPRLPGIVLTAPGLNSPLTFARRELFQELATAAALT
ncbi:MAG: late competence development ComFB family protein [Pseudanabaenaceae cyanobacterium SKYGB_i_bin29]|nr:late competence development ComFB family protein [Pseudanabaenaceae cyanobacterium SKYG29]MDW8422092.1 late competence development ComFB family protein [Pseudanabaenaceae cyanobacterium SKYGB_i_bin29]